MHHPEIGPLELHFEGLSLPDDSGQSVLICTAKPGDPAFESLQLLQVPTPAKSGDVCFTSIKGRRKAQHNVFRIARLIF